MSEIKIDEFSDRVLMPRDVVNALVSERDRYKAELERLRKVVIDFEDGSSMTVGEWDDCTPKETLTDKG